LAAGLGISPASAEPTAKHVLKTLCGASEPHRLPRHGQHAQARDWCLPVEADRGQSPRRACPWIAARIPYIQNIQTEAYRSGNKIVDDWQDRVNSWPLDEGLIDYVAESYGSESPEKERYVANALGERRWVARHR